MDELQALEHLRQTPLRELDDVSRATKIPRATLIKIKYRTTEYPRLPNLKKIVAWASRNEVKRVAA